MDDDSSAWLTKVGRWLDRHPIPQGERSPFVRLSTLADPFDDAEGDSDALYMKINDYIQRDPLYKPLIDYLRGVAQQMYPYVFFRSFIFLL